MNAPRGSRLVAGVVIVVMFLAGVAVGFFLHSRMRGPGGPGLAIRGPHPAPPPAVKGWMLGRLDQELHLSPAQHARIDSVLTRRETELRALMGEARPRFEAIAERTRADIRAVLTPAQQDTFTEITKRMEAHRASHHRALRSMGEPPAP